MSFGYLWVAPDTLSAERDDYGQAVLECRTRDTLLSGFTFAEVEMGRPTSNANGGGSD